MIGFLSLVSSLAAHGQTSWIGGAGPGDFTNSSNWNNGAPLNKVATVDTSSGTVTIFLSSPTPNPYSIDGLTVQGGNVLTFNQNSGTLTFASGALDFGTSNSIYNLTGTSSILQVGGASGITGTGTLSLEGGILQVINSNLSVGANVNTTLADDIYSVVNTNGFNAAFNGSVIGATGGLVKTGTGVLSLNGANNTIGSFGITGGTVLQSTGTLTTTELAVGTGAGNSGSYTMTGGSLIFPTGPLPLIIGASATASSFRIGDFGGTGTFTQSGGSVTVMGGMDIGNQGGTGTYNISGGTLDFSDGLYALGRTTSSATAAGAGIMNISGTAVITVHDGNFIIGDRDSTGLQGTGIVNQSGGTLTISGTSGLFLSAYGDGAYNLTGGTLQIGGTSLSGHYAGTGSYQFDFAGGEIQVIGFALITDVDMNLGNDVYSVIDTNGLGATLNGTINGTTGGLFKMGTGNLTLNGSSNTIGSFLVAGGGVVQSTGTLTTTELAVGTGTVTGTPGGLGNTGAYTLSGGSLIFPGGTTPAIVGGGSSNSFRVGDFGGTGIFTQTAGAVVLGTSTGTTSLTIGNKGGNGTYNLQGGTLTLAGPGFIDLGLSTSTTYGATSGTMNISGGTLEIGSQGYLAIGDNNAGVPANEATGVINQTGGTIIIDTGGTFYLSGYGTGTYNFDGGVLEVGGTDLQSHVGAGAPTANFNFGGGTIMVTGTLLVADVDVNLMADTYSIINTNGLGANWSGTINGATGGLAKIGAGDLALTGSNNTIGSFLVAGGSVTQSTGTLTTTELAVGTGAGNSGSYNLTGGTLVFPGGTPPLIVGATATSASFRIGDFGGTGTFTQTGGSVSDFGSMDIGNEGGDGTYNISGGSLYLSGGLYDLGRTTSSSTAASTGVMNISGSATVTVDGPSVNFIVGDRDSTGLQGTGTLNQSGGTLTIENGAGLFLAGYGTGNVYNFTGGIFQVGGSGLNAQYGSENEGTYQFNLGGGTIQVIGSDLVTAVDATLVGTTTSTIDTGSLNATWTGLLTGSGNLAKTGTGSLTLANINTTGLFDLQNGTAVSSGAANAIGQLYVDGGNTTDLQVDTGNSLTITPGSSTTAGRIYENSTLNIFGGGTVNIEGALAIGRPSMADPGASSSGTLNIFGNTQLNFDFSGYTNMFVGSGGGVAGTQGTVNQQDTSKVILGSNMIIGADNATASYNLSGNASLVTSASPAAFIYIGLNQLSADTAGTTSGLLSISGSSIFTVGQGSELRVGTGDNKVSDGDDAVFGATGEIIQNGAGSVVTFDGAGAWFGNYLTDTTGSMIGSTGTYELDAGTLNIQSGTTSFGESAGATGYLIQTGGTLTAITNVLIGNSGTGTYNMSGGTATFQNGLTVGNNSDSLGSVNQTAGIVNLTGGNLDLKQSTSTYNLSGGQFGVGGSGVAGLGQLNINGGTLFGNGLVAAATVVSSSGVIAPGSTTAGIHTPGLLTFSNLSLNSASIYAWNLASESVGGAGTNFDEIKVSAGGNILLNGALTFNLSFGSGIDFSDEFWTTAETWDVIDASAGGASLTGTASFIINSPGATGGTFSAIQIGDQVDLTWTPTAVPEPSTWLLVGVGAMALLVLRRKREI